MERELRQTPVAVSMGPFGVSAFRSRHAVGFRMAPRRDNFDKICCVDEGKGTLRIDDPDSTMLKQTDLAGGTTILVPAGLPHYFVDDDSQPMTLSIVCIRPGLLEQAPSTKSLWSAVKSSCSLANPQQLSNPYSIGECRRLFRQIVVELGRDLPNRDAAILATLTQLLVLLTRVLGPQADQEPGSSGAAFEASVAYLENHFMEPLEISELAQIAGMSYRAYTDRFKQRKGMTASRYWNHLRIELAKKRLLSTRDILGSSLDAGFQDLSHFYKIFKRLVGETPNEFIVQHTSLASAGSARQ